MIYIKDNKKPDYENSGFLYTIEVTTDSPYEYDLIMEYIQQAIEYRKQQIRRLTTNGK